ncbi:hypothetical protein EHQ58_06815 [Leptospira ognonensis]|uniref:Uncharacterized protein n=1 Tax=Leptospira ognonensis TaxID=2484945 RepID=A0A4R9K435_9LEPT|nr:hypothetical protein [Leptospira ognonensis]TGL60206.1 hypothetical protein EHQ58_06815 [Leptospira ognonensis]
MSASALKEGAKGGVKITAIIVASSLIIAAGGGLTYLGVTNNINELGAIGLAIMVFGLVKGAEWSKVAIEGTAKNIKEDLDTSKEYRYVRFLPEYIWITPSHTKRIDIPISNSKAKSIRIVKPFGKIPIQYGFFSDTDK